MKVPARIRTILFPTDFSPLGNAALPYAILLATAFRSKIVLMHVMTRAEQASLDAGSPLRLKAGCADEFNRLMIDTSKQVKDQLGETMVLTDYIIEEGGTPARRIVEQAAAKSADLIIMTTHGRSGFARKLTGSVAEHVIRDAGCPVIALRPASVAPPGAMPARFKISRVLVPTDLSDKSLHVLPLAAALVRPFGASLTALHVTRETTAGDPGDALRQFIGMNFESSVPVTCATRHGDPAEQIVNFALHDHTDLIAMTTRGDRVIRNRVFGGTAEHVLRIAPCPLLVVK